ncbi:MAG: TadE/TadG family type IV pilus assembly protein [Acidimicrobiia bacterium]
MAGEHGTRRHGARDGGQSTVELALLLPVVVVLLLAVLQVALVARDLVLVSHATREAARAAAVGEDALDAARAGGGLEADRLQVTVRGGREPGDRATVTVRYRAPTEVPLVGRLLPDVPLTSTARARVEKGR